jgi:dimethylargininase
LQDTAIALNNRILLTQPGAVSRRGEITAVKKRLEQIASKLKLDLVQVQDPEAFIDGGDVLFTGKEFVVGMSTRTNAKGVRALENAFEGVNVIPVLLKEGLHLKCFTTMIDKDTILIGSSDCAKSIRSQIEKHSKFVSSYRYFLFGLSNLNQVFISEYTI